MVSSRVDLLSQLTKSNSTHRRCTSTKVVCTKFCVALSDRTHLPTIHGLREAPGLLPFRDKYSYRFGICEIMQEWTRETHPLLHLHCSASTGPPIAIWLICVDGAQGGIFLPSIFLLWQLQDMCTLLLILSCSWSDQPGILFASNCSCRTGGRLFIRCFS